MPLELPVIGCDLGKARSIHDQDLALEVQKNQNLLIMHCNVWGVDYKLLVYPKTQDFTKLKNRLTYKNMVDKRSVYIVNSLTIDGKPFDEWYKDNQDKNKDLEKAIITRFINNPNVHSKFFNSEAPMTIFVDAKNQIVNADSFVVVPEKEIEAKSESAGYFGWLPSFRIW